MKKVWVVYSDMRYDGYSIPFKAFSTEDKAREFCDNSDDDFIDYYEELEVE